MQFSCPSCGKTYAFSEDQLTPEGVVVACTACRAYIRLIPSAEPSLALTDSRVSQAIDFEDSDESVNDHSVDAEAQSPSDSLQDLSFDPADGGPFDSTDTGFERSESRRSRSENDISQSLDASSDISDAPLHVSFSTPAYAVDAVQDGKSTSTYVGGGLQAGFESGENEVLPSQPVEALSANVDELPQAVETPFTTYDPAAQSVLESFEHLSDDLGFGKSTATYAGLPISGVMDSLESDGEDSHFEKSESTSAGSPIDELESSSSSEESAAQVESLSTHQVEESSTTADESDDHVEQSDHSEDDMHHETTDAASQSAEVASTNETSASKAEKASSVASSSSHFSSLNISKTSSSSWTGLPRTASSGWSNSLTMSRPSSWSKSSSDHSAEPAHIQDLMASAAENDEPVLQEDIAPSVSRALSSMNESVQGVNSPSFDPKEASAGGETSDQNDETPKNTSGTQPSLSKDGVSQSLEAPSVRPERSSSLSLGVDHESGSDSSTMSEGDSESKSNLNTVSEGDSESKSKSNTVLESDSESRSVNPTAEKVEPVTKDASVAVKKEASLDSDSASNSELEATNEAESSELTAETSNDEAKRKRKRKPKTKEAPLPPPILWKLSDLPLTFAALLEVKLMGTATLAVWALLGVFGLLRMLGEIVGEHVSFLGVLFSLLGYGVFAAGVCLVLGVLSVVFQQKLLDHTDGNVRQAFTWCISQVRGVLGVPSFFVGAVALAALAEAIVGFLAGIPAVGPVIWGIFSPATFALSYAVALSGFVMWFALSLHVPILKCEHLTPRETLYRLKDLALTKATKLLLGGLIVAAFVALLAAISVLLLVCSSWFTAEIGNGAMGSQLGSLLASAPKGPLSTFLNLSIWECSFSFANEPSTSHTIGAFIASLGAALPIAAILSLLLSIYTLGGTILYSVLTDKPKS